MISVSRVKISISFILIFLVVGLHGFLRFSEMPYSKRVLRNEFWLASINLAAGKSFSDPTFLNKSPELSSFVNIPFSEYVNGIFFKGVKGDIPLSKTIYEFTDYPVGPKFLFSRDSIGYRYILGLIWKFFGFNWYYVSVYNYIFSLMALLSLMYCSYKTLGFVYSISIGLIYSISILEISFIVNMGRDGFPLWFACYLICTLVLFLNKPMTLKRIVIYSILLGAITFAATQGRSSCIYFVPLLSLIYFLLFFFFKVDEIKFKYFYFLKNPFFKKSFLFLISTSMTLLSVIILQEFLNYLLLNEFGPDPRYLTMHHIFLGLGMWGNEVMCFSPLYYADGHAYHLAEDYGRRVLGHNSVLYCSLVYHETLKDLYLSFIKTYPHFYFSKVVFGSFYKTLFYLGFPSSGSSISLNSDEVKLLSKYTDFIFKNHLISWGAAFGSLILYFKLRQKKITIILVSFVLFNAGVSFLQFNVRHVLMGHPAYYFLAGVTMAYVFESILSFFSNYMRISSKGIHFIANPLQSKGIGTLRRLAHFKFNISTLSLLGLAIVSIPTLVYLAKSKLKSIEERNISYAQEYFESLEKHPLEFDAAQKLIKLPDSLIFKTIGVYCEMGKVNSPTRIGVEMMEGESKFYSKTIIPTFGENVILFTPFYFFSDKMTLNVSNLNQCKSLYWSDLKDWEGPLWEGSYDKNVLKKPDYL